MQLTLSLVMALASGFFLEAVADSAFGATCNSLGLSYPEKCASGNCEQYMIVADCKEESGIYTVGVWIGLDNCIANANGVIQAQANGRFSASCPKASLSGTTLTTSCKNDGGSLVTSSLNLNNFVGNDNGDMCCFGHCGV